MKIKIQKNVTAKVFRRLGYEAVQLEGAVLEVNRKEDVEDLIEEGFAKPVTVGAAAKPDKAKAEKEIAKANVAKEVIERKKAEQKISKMNNGKE
jgi:ribosomal protein L12E/L44/L45/RPP1/RPP2